MKKWFGMSWAVTEVLVKSVLRDFSSNTHFLSFRICSLLNYNFSLSLSLSLLLFFGARLRSKGQLWDDVKKKPNLSLSNIHLKKIEGKGDWLQQFLRLKQQAIFWFCFRLHWNVKFVKFENQNRNQNQNQNQNLLNRQHLLSNWLSASNTIRNETRRNENDHRYLIKVD